MFFLVFPPYIALKAVEILNNQYKELLHTDAGKLDAAGKDASFKTLQKGIIQLGDYKIAKTVRFTYRIIKNI